MLKKTIRVLLPVFTFKLGGFTLAFGYGTMSGHPISTVCFFGGLILFVASIVGFILAVRDNETNREVSDSYTSLLNTIAFYVLGVFIIIYLLSTGWSEFDDSKGQKTIVATYLAIAIAGISYSNYSLSKRDNSYYTLATLAVNLFGFFGCLYYLAAVEDGYISPVSVGSEKEQVIEVRENSVFIGTGKDTAYYKVGDKKIIDKQALDSVR